MWNSNINCVNISSNINNLNQLLFAGNIIFKYWFCDSSDTSMYYYDLNKAQSYFYQLLTLGATVLPLITLKVILSASYGCRLLSTWYCLQNRACVFNHAHSQLWEALYNMEYGFVS